MLQDLPQDQWPASSSAKPEDNNNETNGITKQTESTVVEKDEPVKLTNEHRDPVESSLELRPESPTTSPQKPDADQVGDNSTARQDELSDSQKDNEFLPPRRSKRKRRPPIKYC